MPTRRAAPAADLALQYAVSRRGVPARASIERWLSVALTRAAALTVRIVGAAEGRALNRTFRGRDYPTNVLTFVYAAAPLTGDIVLCAPVIAREARAQGKPLAAHYAHLVVHGALHLQGHDHERSQAAAVRMESREKAILARLGYPDPYRVPPPSQPRITHRNGRRA